MKKEYKHLSELTANQEAVLDRSVYAVVDRVTMTKYINIDHEKGANIIQLL
jgi:hypothetical protein